MLNKVREIVKAESPERMWKYHILLVVKYSKLLARKLGANEELAEIGALLHDIGRIRVGEENHEITGPLEAEKILKGLNFSQTIIDEIKHCIESHRSSKDTKPRTIIAKIIANADAMAHFDIIPVLLQIGLERAGNIETATVWLMEKLERDWNKKLTIPEAKKLVQKKYQAAKLLLNSYQDR